MSPVLAHLFAVPWLCLCAAGVFYALRGLRAVGGAIGELREPTFSKRSAPDREKLLLTATQNWTDEMTRLAIGIVDGVTGFVALTPSLVSATVMHFHLQGISPTPTATVGGWIIVAGLLTSKCLLSSKQWRADRLRRHLQALNRMMPEEYRND